MLILPGKRICLRWIAPAHQAHAISGELSWGESIFQRGRWPLFLFSGHPIGDRSHLGPAVCHTAPATVEARILTAFVAGSTGMPTNRRRAGSQRDKFLQAGFPPAFERP